MADLSTRAGNGGLNVGVDALGAFGSSVGGTGTSDALYDPLGEIDQAGTVFQSYVSIGINNDDAPARTRLSSVNIADAEFSTETNTRAVSSFNVSGLDFELEQVVTDLNRDGERTGSNLVQTYTITNPGDETIEFDLVRYLDGDLGFDGSIADTGGRFLNDNQEILFETDSGDNGTEATTFLGITADGTNGQEERYEITEFSELRTKIDAGQPLNNQIQGDGNDQNQFVEIDPFDITLSLGETFTLAPGESTTYTTRTIFGSGVPQEVEIEENEPRNTPTPNLVSQPLNTVNEFTGDRLRGTASRDLLLGTAESNILEGLGDNDALVGGAGDDQLNGGQGNDTAVYQDDEGAVVINLATDTATDGFEANDTLTSIENIIGSQFGDRLTGNAQDNQLTGGGGNDTLSGGQGDDYIIGLGGVDVLTGNAGTDNFAYVTPEEGRDRIEDFNPDDTILIVGATFPGGLSTGLLSESQFTLGTEATTANHRFIFNQDNGQLFFDRDGDGSANSQLLATFTDTPEVTAENISIV